MTTRNLPPDLSTWLHRDLAGEFDRWYEAGLPVRSWITMSDLCAGDWAMLREMHLRTTQAGTTPRAAAMFVAGWLGGSVSTAVGFGLIDANVGLQPDARNVRWGVHPDGWVDAVSFDATTEFHSVLVMDTHPWCGTSGVGAVASEQLVPVTMANMVRFLTPVIEACASLARVSRVGLWNEISDAFGMVLAFQTERRDRSEDIDMLDRALRTVTGRWRARPRLHTAFAADGSSGQLVIGQKGGCCLSYTADPERADYCSTCSLREPPEVERRQLEWHARRSASLPEPAG